MVGHHHIGVQGAKSALQCSRFFDGASNAFGDGRLPQPSGAEGSRIQFTIHLPEGAAIDHLPPGAPRASWQSAKQPPGDEDGRAVWPPMRQVAPVHAQGNSVRRAENVARFLDAQAEGLCHGLAGRVPSLKVQADEIELLKW